MSDVRYQLLIDGEADQDLTDDAVEIEVVEGIEEPTRIRVKVVTEIVDDDFARLDDDDLKPSEDDHKLAVIAVVEGETHCLGQGIIVDRRIEYVLGGPGSSVEFIVLDRRVLMDRQVKFKAHTGTASEIVEQILEGYEFETDVEDTDVEFREEDHTLNQAATDLQFVTRQAARHGLRFWVDAKAESSLFGGTEITETAHFKRSPPESEGGGLGLGGLPVPLPSILTGGGSKELRLNTGPDTTNLNSFRLQTNNEVPNQSPPLLRVNLGDGAVDDTEVTGPTVDPLGDVPPPGQTRTRILVTAGSIEEARAVNRGAVNDAAWVVQATAETTAHALGDLVRPHDVVKVKGAGKTADGDYFVEGVTHFITPADHRMTLDLRRNALGA
jgi:hypothetical protein